MKYQIFISYRREGGDVTAKLICEALKNKGYTVFYDYDSLKGGTFDSKIFNTIDNCQDVVLVLPPKAFARCRNENDWLRQEIKRALEKEKNIVPVMMNKFEFPKKLPLDIKDIIRYNGVRFHMDFFESVIDKIVEKLSAEPDNGKGFFQKTKDILSVAKKIEIVVWSPVNTDVYLNDKKHLIMKIDHNSGFDYARNSINVCGTFDLIFVSKGFEKVVTFNVNEVADRLEYRLNAILSDKEIRSSYDRVEAIEQIKDKATAYAYKQLSITGTEDDLRLLINELKKLESIPTKSPQENYLIATCFSAIGALAIKFDKLEDVEFLIKVYDNYEAKSSYGWMMEPIVKKLKGDNL